MKLLLGDCRWRQTLNQHHSESRVANHSIDIIRESVSRRQTYNWHHSKLRVGNHSVAIINESDFRHLQVLAEFRIRELKPEQVQWATEPQIQLNRCPALIEQ